MSRPFELLILVAMAYQFALAPPFGKTYPGPLWLQRQQAPPGADVERTPEAAWSEVFRFG